MEYELCDAKNPNMIDFKCVAKVLNDIGITNDMIGAITVISIITLIVLIVWYKIIPALPMKR